MPVKMPIKRTKREITSKIVCNRSASFIAGKKLTKYLIFYFIDIEIEKLKKQPLLLMILSRTWKAT